MEKLFLKQKQYLDTFYNKLDFNACQNLFDRLKKNKGVLFFSGIGKSGFIAQKIAATMMSTGTKAFFLPPTDALHGDLGMVSEKDTVLLMSKSGETEEMLQLLPVLRSKGVQVMALCSNSRSRLVQGVETSVILPCENELCPFDLAPTTSTEVQLLFGDVLTIALMEYNRFTLDQYAVNHPSGRIGRRATAKVKDLMLDEKRTPTCRPDDLLAQVLVEFTDKRCGCLLVIDEERKLKGIFTDGDLRRALQEKGDQVLKEKIESLMTLAPKSIDEDALAWDAVKVMESNQKSPVMVLPVLEKERGEVVGIIKMHDLIQAGL
ncbi:MAG: Arabinose 5-phosphate isomerase KdsD [Chlamydiales bacterium]|nr:Arabinose 5-phosphate isomerase KdsD [Chlamydiales bacterium]MCH9619236.1 Arabinose 5-phosphate isomerase KdsD [Chlamydiales bacterium]MCH9622498.1 Arabinose 5-phosphate isomerase KdsD [Chlamydiales bacterium]